MRIASAGIQQETNTFSVTPTTLADFVRDSGLGPDFPDGEKLALRFRDTGTVHGGYLAGAEEAGFELFPLLNVQAQPSGVVRKEAFDTLLGLLLDRLKSMLPVDGVLLDLHGAMVAESDEDAEGAILAAVRAVVGPALPVIVTLDLHANVSARMAAMATSVIGFDTYPHVDMYDRGREAALLMARILSGEVRPVMAFRQLPLITFPPGQCTLREPMQSLMRRVHALESEPGLLTATVAMGFPFADIRDAGGSVMVTADGDAALAERKADELARWVWELRDELQPSLTPMKEVIRFARSEAKGLVICADGSDNPGGGAPCDGTVALEAMIDADFQGGAIGVLYDPETVQAACEAGVGKTFTARIGGKTDDRHGKPVVCPVYVKTLTDGRFVHRGPMKHLLPGNLGPTAVLQVGGVTVVVASARCQALDAEMFRCAGVCPENYRLLVVKSAVHFRAHLGPLAAHIFDADTPGIHRPDFANIQFRKLRRPIYPLDGHAVPRFEGTQSS